MGFAVAVVAAGCAEVDLTTSETFAVTGSLEWGAAPAGVPWVSAEVMDTTAVPPRSPADAEPEPEDAGMAFDPAMYLPMPLPHDPQREPRRAGRPASPAGMLATLDLRTGVETLREVAAATGSESAEAHTAEQLASGIALRQNQDGAGDSPDVGVENFGALSLVGDATSGVYPRSVKVFFDKSGGSYVCSGSLIDAKHVITAGHCVHEGDGGDWASNVRVVPSYDSGVEPYGRANGVQLHSWTGWTQDGDWDHDIGVIDLDRPIGALTGWNGYGYHEDCSYFKGGTWIHSGYPAESPYNGQDMYTQSGDFDGCDIFLGIWTGNEVTFDRESFGGSSGTGATRSGVVRAVLSNGNSSHTDDVRLTSDKFGHIGTMISEDSATTYDLTPLNVVTAPSSAARGSYLSSMSYLVHNDSSASVNSTYTVRVYLSTNQFISTGDTLLQTHSFSWNFAAKGSVRVNVSSPPRIPTTVSTGTYYVGVIVDVPDASSGNNNTEGWDSSRVVVY